MSVTITKRGVLPVIEIQKNDDTAYQTTPFIPTSVYTYNHFTSTYDFRVKNYRVKPPFENEAGDFSVTIMSSDISNSAANTLLDNIKEGNEILFKFGKSNTNLTSVMRGIIEKIRIRESLKGFMEIELSGPDWGSDILSHRVIAHSWTQKPSTTDPTLFDESDDTTKVSQIVTDILNKSTVYPIDGGPTCAGQGVVVSASNIVPNSDIRVPQFVANYEIINDKLRQLDQISGSIHYINTSKNFIMSAPPDVTGSTSATFLFTDDTTNVTATAFSDQTKVGLILEGDYMKSLEDHVRRVIGLGAGLELLDQSSTTNTSSTAADTVYIAVRFTPKQIELRNVHLFLERIGTPSDCIVSIIEEQDSKPVGSTLAFASKSKDAILVDGVGAWHSFKFNIKLNTSKNYWIVLHSQDASNYYKWHRDALDTGVYATSTTGSTTASEWTLATTPNRYNFMFRTYSNKPIVMPGGDLSATMKHGHEKTMRIPTIDQIHVQGYLQSAIATDLNKTKHIYKFKAYSPDTLLISGTKIMIQKSSSGFVIQSEFVVGSIEYTGDSNSDISTGNSYLDITAIKYEIYT